MLQENESAQASIREYGSMQEAYVAAAEAAVATSGRPVSGILYSQGGRKMISTSVPIKTALAITRTDSAKKKEDPSAHRNRPLSPGHVRELVEYITTEPKYLLPPITVNAASRLQVFVYGQTAPVRPCVFVLPPDEYLCLADGQHRTEALRAAVGRRPQLEQDGIGVTIIEELDIDKVHQDFFDAAQALSLAKSLLVEYDGRAPLNWLTREVLTTARIFKGRIERVGDIGKNSLMLFTTNQVKQGILQVVVGDWSLFADAIRKRAEDAVAPARDLWRDSLVSLFDAFTSANEQWRTVADRPLESGLITDIPAMRQKYLHFTGAGLLVIGGVGHSILQLNPKPDGALSDEQVHCVRRLASLDWSREGSLWQGYIVGSAGNVSTMKPNIALAVAKAKEAIGLKLTEKEANRMANPS